MKSKSSGILLRVTISLTALALIVYFLRSKLEDAIHIVATEVNWPFFFVAAFTYLIAITLLSLRLQMIFKSENVRINYREVFYLSFVGLFFNLFFPSAVGGDIAKAYYAYQHSGKKIASTSAVILDRLFGFMTIMIMAVIAVILFGKQMNVPQANHLVFGFLGLMTFCVLFFSSKKVAGSFKFIKVLIPSKPLQGAMTQIYHIIHSYKKKIPVFLTCIAVSFIAQSFFISVHYLLCRALHVDLSIERFFILVPIIGIVSMAPSIGGLGVREAGAIYFFSQFMSAERALALSLLMDLVIYGFSIAGGLLFAFQGGLQKRSLKEMEKMNVAQS